MIYSLIFSSLIDNLLNIFLWREARPINIFLKIRLRAPFLTLIIYYNYIINIIVTYRTLIKKFSNNNITRSGLLFYFIILLISYNKIVINL